MGVSSRGEPNVHFWRDKIFRRLPKFVNVSFSIEEANYRIAFKYEGEVIRNLTIPESGYYRLEAWGADVEEDLQDQKEPIQNRFCTFQREKSYKFSLEKEATQE